MTRRILVFEPDPALRLLLTNSIRDAGMAADAAADVIAARDRLDLGPTYDLLIVGDPEPPSTAATLLEAVGAARLAGKRILALTVVSEDEIAAAAPGCKVAVARRPRSAQVMNAILRAILPAA